MAKSKWIIVTLGIGLVSAGLILYLLYRDYHAFLTSPLNVPATGLVFVVPPGDSMAGLAQRLAAEGVLRSADYFRIYGRLSGLAPRLKSGEYRIEPGTTPRTLLRQLVQGRVIQYALTVVEGWTFRQMLEAIAGHDKLKHTLIGHNDSEVMARLGRPGEHPEGLFFPDTYHFPAGTTDVDFLKRALRNLQQQLQAAWQRRVPGLPLQTPYEALILASIIEKETGLAKERRKIAGVFVRRLQKGMPLQTDPTVIYGLGETFDGNIRKRDLRTDTPYNTYTRKGLPPTPIALPGAASIAAAVNPAPGDALYFVATGDGGHVFSKTLREHNRAVREYQLRRPR
jgi:UPF0755 protein